MKVVYNAPNRAHHYAYARQLHQAGVLKAFVSGFSRLSPRSPIPEIGGVLKRSDLLQTLFVGSQKLKLPQWVSEELAYWAKLQLDRASRRPLRTADIFLYYNGCGLRSAREFKRNGGINIVEAVNSHVLAQEQLLMDEHKFLGLPWRSFHRREVRRRVAEVAEADYVLLPSKFVERSFLAQGIPAERLLRVPYPMQKIAGISSGAQKMEKQSDVFRVLYVGSISVRKGLKYLVEAFRALKHPAKELWLVGPMSHPNGLEDIIIPDGVRFLGVLKGDALQAAYQGATVFCLPSIEEGLALVLSEALSHGLPVIATINTGAEDLLLDGKGGKIVPIRDPLAIANELTRLGEDKEYFQSKQTEAWHVAKRLGEDSGAATLLAKTLENMFHSKNRGR